MLTIIQMMDSRWLRRGLEPIKTTATSAIMTNLILEKGKYKLYCFYHPERHFAIYENDIAVFLTKYEKEAIRVFSQLTKGK